MAKAVPVVSVRLENEVVSSTANWFVARDTAAPRSWAWNPTLLAKTAIPEKVKTPNRRMYMDIAVSKMVKPA